MYIIHVFVIFAVSNVLGFTREYRKYNHSLFQFDGQSLYLSFDPGLLDFKDAIYSFCSHFQCHEPEGVLFTIERRFDDFLDDRLKSIGEVVVAGQGNSQWADMGDNQVMKEVQSIDMAKMRWKQVLLQLRQNHTSRFSGVYVAALLGDVLGSKTFSSNQSSLNLVDIASELFHAEYYDLAMIICYAYVLDMIQQEWNDDGETMVNALNIMAEGHRLRGQMQHAVLYYIKIVMLHKRLSSLLSSRQAIHRLRLLLAIPVLPPTATYATTQRAAMLEDVTLWTEHIRKENTTVSLQDLLASVTSTPFHMAHQGENDIGIQLAVAQAYTQLCPELLYIAPRLLTTRNIERGDGWSPSGDHPNKTPKGGICESCDSSIDSGVGDSGGGIGGNISLTHLSNTHPQLRTPYRIGFISSNFFDHSIGRILVELLANMNSPDLGLELTVFLVDKNVHNKEHIMDVRDQITDILETILGASGGDEAGKKGRFVRLSGDILTIREVVGSTEYSLDALVFADVGMELSSYVLSHSRLAPIQIAWWGHPITTASDAIDYFFGLDIELPSATKQYSEQLIRMEVMNTAPYVKVPLDVSISHTVFGLPPDSKFCLVLGRLFKLHPSFDEALFRILLSTPDDVYIVFVRERNPDLNRMLYERWEAYQEQICCKRNDIDGASANGDNRNEIPSCCHNMNFYEHMYQTRHRQLLNEKVRDRMWDNMSTSQRSGHNSVHSATTDSRRNSGIYVLHRLRFIHYASYLNALLHARVVLDTYPYGGCLTSHDAMSNGVPMVTLPSDFARGRYSYGMYTQMKHTDLIADNISHYVALVTHLVKDDNYWNDQREKVETQFRDNIHQNDLVGKEWVQFLKSAINSMG